MQGLLQLPPWCLPMHPPQWQQSGWGTEADARRTLDDPLESVLRTNASTGPGASSVCEDSNLEPRYYAPRLLLTDNYTFSIILRIGTRWGRSVEGEAVLPQA